MEGPADAFCCAGCEMAAAIIRGAGLERYYAERTEFAPRPEPAHTGDWDAVPVTSDARGICEARLVVDGLRCASCVWVTERVLARTPGVVRASVSYATGRATLRWNPSQVDLPTLARRIAALGYRPRPLALATAPDRGLMVRAGLALFASLAVMGLYEGLYAGWWYDAMQPAYAALFRWTSLALATPVTLWCAEPFFAGAWSGLRNRVLHMDLPIALGVLILYVHGIVATLLRQDAYLDSLTMLVALLLVGRVLESRGRRRTTEAAAALVGHVPRTARRVDDGAAGRITVVPMSEIRPGDLVDVAAGEELPVDGVVREGTGQVRMALLTGEAAPVPVAPGDRVIAGTLLADGALTVAAEAVGVGTVVHRMASQLQLAQERAMTPTSADRIAPWFTAGTLLVAAATLAGWWIVGGAELAVPRTVAVLVVACPCALALAQPLAAAAGLAAAARRGLLLRSGDVLLELALVNEVGLDKTGTVTAGAAVVTAADDRTLRIAAGLERYSAHPIARAITAEAGRRGIPLPRAADVHETPGVGVEGMVDGRRWRLGGGASGELLLSGDDPATLPPDPTIRLGDVTRPDARHAMEQVRRLGLRSTLLTGDHPDTARQVAAETGVDEVLARADPAAKVSWVRARQQAGRRVVFAGDGLNDGPALAAADIGIAMSSGAAASVLVADGIVSPPSLVPIAAGIRAARAARAAVNRSLRRSIVYNVLAVSAAVAGFVNPLVAAVLMPLSSGVVIWSAARVERAVRRDEAT
ncbi:MAG TPA: heavy metal translocating P-type ATPase metal-binding domain-containing protein [Gemmatimonadales bacterium]|nr:heavy metal translocating P-type ATPase metal-binding domain-containing protein [Gemmatimonadales bacterium]